MQVRVINDDSSTTNDKNPALVMHTITTERFIGTFDNAQNAAKAPKQYIEKRTLSIHYKPFDKYCSVSRALQRACLRQWIDRVLTFPSQVNSKFTLFFQNCVLSEHVVFASLLLIVHSKQHFILQILSVI